MLCVKKIYIIVDNKKNHKTKGNSKKREKREAKREKEKEVLALFKKEGEDSLKSIKQARKILKEADKETKKKEELFSKPPHICPQRDTSQYLRVL